MLRQPMHLHKHSPKLTCALVSRNGRVSLTRWNTGAALERRVLGSLPSSMCAAAIALDSKKVSLLFFFDTTRFSERDEKGVPYEVV